MPADLLAPARKYRESAVVELLEGYYPLVHRMAYALCGDAAIARRLVDTVFRRALGILPRWRDDSAADRWFYRHTVQESRRYEADRRGQETLVDAGPRGEEFVAFVRALRGLPSQQCEAVLLTHGEHLNPRYLGVAMDCSAEAAANHLRAGTQQLQALSSQNYAALIETLSRAYRQLAPPPDTARPEIRRHLSTFLRPRIVRRWIVRILLLSVLLGAIVWHHDLVEWIKRAFDSLTSSTTTPAA